MEPRQWFGHGQRQHRWLAEPVNADLATLAYLDNSSGSDTITVTTSDLADKSSAVKSIGVTIDAPALPDLTANSLVVGSKSLFTGGSTTISYQIANAPGGAAAGASTAEAVLYNATQIWVVETQPVVALAAGASVTESGTITVPTGLTPGIYDLAILADATNQVTESNENNNWTDPVVLNISTVSPPSLAIASASLQSNQTTVSLSGTIDTADAGLTVSIDDGSTVLGTATANGSGAWSANVTVSAQGVHTLTVQATNVNGTGVSNSVVDLVNASTSLSGGGQTVLFSGPGNSVSLAGTAGTWDSVTGSNGTIYLTSAQAAVTGGGNSIGFAGSGDIAGLYNTGGAWDSVWGSNETVYLTNAQASVTGNSNTLNFLGTGNTATVSGSSDAFVFQAAFGQDVINGFASSDTMQLAASDFANWSALLAHMTQSGSNTLITLDASDQITLTGVTASSLQSSQFHFQ